jgi:hypothetical protein
MTLNTSTRSTDFNGMTGIGTSNLCRHASRSGANASRKLKLIVLKKSHRRQEL